jgi:hypothetical protein
MSFGSGESRTSLVGDRLFSPTVSVDCLRGLTQNLMRIPSSVNRRSNRDPRGIASIRKRAMREPLQQPSIRFDGSCRWFTALVTGMIGDK